VVIITNSTYSIYNVCVPKQKLYKTLMQTVLLNLWRFWRFFQNLY